MLQIEDLSDWSIVTFLSSVLVQSFSLCVPSRFDKNYYCKFQYWLVYDVLIFYIVYFVLFCKLQVSTQLLRIEFLLLLNTDGKCFMSMKLISFKNVQCQMIVLLQIKLSLNLKVRRKNGTEIRRYEFVLAISK